MDKKILEYLNTTNRSPGPAAYNINSTIAHQGKIQDPTIEQPPVYTLTARKMIATKPLGPGPYDTSGFNRYGKDTAPGVLFGNPAPKIRAQETPGPSDYCPVYPKKIPGFKMAPWPSTTDRRQQDAKKRDSPAPNAYNIPSTLNGPAIHISHRLKSKAPEVTPGPNHYEFVKPDVYKKSAPRQSMGCRLYNKTRDLPGPANYDSAYCASRPTTRSGMTFGIRVSDKIGVFAVPSAVWRQQKRNTVLGNTTLWKWNKNKETTGTLVSPSSLKLLAINRLASRIVPIKLGVRRTI
ncbi:outer dense fiber protein 3-like [Daktulosphaira vitifoliae]|uniref:outer dense fiber protein 3-like n=1 Tax=Daktulosphaira vitifoliae TaxID=58002 RepID=UPI0021AA1FCA|nr:outer dense fiber protein 3-like [Daktulosphaira vitifoliae]